MRALHRRVAAQHDAACAETEAFGDVPDALLDPLVFELMREPVLMPTSFKVRATAGERRMRMRARMRAG